jgi:hypothetical protein
MSCKHKQHIHGDTEALEPHRRQSYEKTIKIRAILTPKTTQTYFFQMFYVSRRYIIILFIIATPNFDKTGHCVAII